MHKAYLYSNFKYIHCLLAENIVVEILFHVVFQALAFSGGYIFMMLLGLAEVQSQAETVSDAAAE